MKRAEKAEKIVEILERLYPNPPIPLDHSDPFTLLIAVMLSAQTTDKKVNEVTPALFEAGPTPERMASLAVPQIQELIRTVGLAPTKAKNVQRTAEMLWQNHDSVVPADLDALEALPGVGHKTAQVVLAQAFDVPSFPVDTHIHRLAARWGLSSGRNVTQTEKDLKRTFEAHLWNDLHLQIIYFGREYCPARSHDLSTCPICGWAASKKRIEQEVKAQSRGRKKSKGRR